MRVAIVIESFSPTRGGRERSTADVALELARQGCQVDVLCMAGQSVLDPVEGFPLYSQADPQVRTVELGRTGWGRTRRLENFLQAAADHAKRESYDVVHAMLPMVQADVYQLRGGTIPGLRQAHLRRLGPLGRSVRKLSWRLNRARNLLGRLEAQLAAERRVWCLPVSDMVAQELAAYYGRTERVRTVFNAVAVPDLPAEQRATLRRDVRKRLGFGDELVLLCPAMNYALKGVRETIQAFAAFRRRLPGGQRARLVVLGDEHPEACERIVSMHSVGEDVRFLPPSRYVWEMYAAADAVVLLSWYDPCSRVVLEATALGLPSLTTAFNGAAEVLRSGAGLVVQSPSDRRTVVESMVRLADPEFRAACAAACAEQAPRLTVRRHVAELLDVYREVAAR